MSEHFTPPPLNSYQLPDGAEFAPAQTLGELFAESAAIDPHKQNIRAYQPAGQETPSFAVRRVRYHDYFDPEAHLRHLETLRASSLNLPDTRIEIATFNDAYMATRWVTPHAPQLLSERISDPTYIDSLRLTLDGLKRYAAWVQGNQEQYIMFDIFDLAQFEYGSQEAVAGPSTWLLDTEPMVCAVDRFKPPLNELASRVDALAHFGLGNRRN